MNHQILGDLLWSLWCRIWNRLGNHFSWFKLSHKNSVLNEQAHVGMEPSKPAKLDGNDTTTLSHHSDILFHFVNYAFCLLCATVHRSIVEGSGVGSAGCEVHVDVHGEWVMLHVGGCNILSMADMVCLVCGVHELGLYRILEYKLCCEILLLMSMADTVCLTKTTYWLHGLCKLAHNLHTVWSQVNRAERKYDLALNPGFQVYLVFGESFFLFLLSITAPKDARKWLVLQVILP